MKHQFFALFFAFLANMGIVHATIYSGSCGANLTWSLNTEDSTLTIKGYGAMKNYVDGTGSDKNIAPWRGKDDIYRRYIKYVIFPDNLTSIGECAFYGCYNISSINIPNSVTSIGKCAFCSCSRLESVTIPNSVTSIEWRTFMGCKNLTAITIPNSITSIGLEAFKYCGFTYVEFPNCTTTIGSEAFGGCNRLDSVILTENITTIASYAFLNCNISSINFIGSVNSWCNKGWSPALVSSNYKLYINNILQRNVIVPDDVTNIGIWAFRYCNSLIDISISNSVTSIERGAFMNCSNLISIIIPDSVTSIGNQIFSGCSSLTTVTIPSSVISIGNESFYGCNSLTTIYNYADTPQQISDIYVFGKVNKSACTLYIPAQSISLYKVADEWKDFNPILAIPGTEAIENVSDKFDGSNKFLRNGQILIPKGGKIFDLRGQEIK